jgi:mono/diheme cytochrome c family protein
MNQEAHVHYDKNKKMKHGIIPFEFNKNSEVTLFDAKAAKRGSKIYKKNCFACHGKSGEGDGPMAESGDFPRPKNLKLHFKNMPSFQFFMKVSQMAGTMPGWKNYFSDQDLRDLSQYLRGLAENKK